MNATPSSTPHSTWTTVAVRPGTDQNQPHVDPAGERALVLGGGGSTGNAWLIGVIAGLLDAGLDVTEADLIVGTSAGSTAAAQLTSTTTTATGLFADILAAAAQQPAGPAGPDRGRGRGPVVNQLGRTSAIIAAAADAADMRRRMGAAALELDADSDASAQERWRATVAARLPSQHWPQRSVLITAVDAHTGGPVVFDRHSGVDLVDAIAASCASGRTDEAVRLAGHRPHRRTQLAASSGRASNRRLTGAPAISGWRTAPTRAKESEAGYVRNDASSSHSCRIVILASSSRDA